MAFAVICSSLSLTAQNSAVNFNDAQPIPLADACSSAFVGKFHRGSKADVVSTCTPPDFPGQGPFTAVLLNQGNGLYRAVEDTPIDGVASPVAVADLDADGVTDLILSQQFKTTLGVQLSKGDGTLGVPVYYTPTPAIAGAEMTAAVTGDFNGDGKIDVAVVTTVFTSSLTISSTNRLTIFINTGGGVLKQAASYALDSIPAGENSPLLAAGRLQGSTKTDLAVVYRGATGKVVPLFAIGNGEFRTGTAFTLGALPVAAAIGDLTASGYGDLVISTQKGIAVRLGSGAGIFSAGPAIPYLYPQLQFGAGARVMLADLDGDGHLDLAFTTSNFVHLYWGNGSGGFTSPEQLTVPQYPLALMGGDTAGSGRADIVVVGNDASVMVLTNMGARGFRAASLTASPNGAGIVAADFNRDGRPDIAVINSPTCKAPCGGTVTVFAGTGSSFFKAGKSYPIGMHGSAIAAGDVNRDGIPDLVVTNATAGDAADVSVLLGTAAGTFQPARNFTLGSLSNDVFLVDENHDGILDLVEDGGVALGIGNGTFGALMPFPAGLGFGKPFPAAFSMHLAVGDLNGDGVPDVVASWVPPGSSIFAAQLWVLLSNGRGGFLANQVNDINLLVQEVDAVAIGKLRTTGPPDFLVANRVIDPNANDFGNVVIFSGDGKGNFTENPNVTAPSDGGGIGAVTVADFNHDGFADIVASTSDQLVVALGKGDGTFLRQVFPTFGITSGSLNDPQGRIAVADFEGDGWPDAMFSSFTGITRAYSRPVPWVSPGQLTWTGSGIKVLTVKNTTSVVQNMSVGLADAGTSPFEVGSTSCDGMLAPGATCTATVSFFAGPTPMADTLYVRANGSFVAYVVLNGN